MLPARLVVVGLAVGQSVAYGVGALVVARVVRSRTGGGAGHEVLRTAVRCLAACVVPGVAVWAVGAGLASALGTGFTGAATTLVVGAPLLALGYLLTVRHMRVPEVDTALRPLLARLGR